MKQVSRSLPINLLALKSRSTSLKNSEYSTKKLSDQLIKDIRKSLKSIDSHGSIEIYVQDSMVTQITIRNIKKTLNHLNLLQN
jgi:hypothetical protein